MGSVRGGHDETKWSIALDALDATAAEFEHTVRHGLAL
jgi:hypothetical protein